MEIDITQLVVLIWLDTEWCVKKYIQDLKDNESFLHLSTNYFCFVLFLFLFLFFYLIFFAFFLLFFVVNFQ